MFCKRVFVSAAFHDRAFAKRCCSSCSVGPTYPPPLLSSDGSTFSSKIFFILIFKLVMSLICHQVAEQQQTIALNEARSREEVIDLNYDITRLRDHVAVVEADRAAELEKLTESYNCKEADLKNRLHGVLREFDVLKIEVCFASPSQFTLSACTGFLHHNPTCDVIITFCILSNICMESPGCIFMQCTQRQQSSVHRKALH